VTITDRPSTDQRSPGTGKGNLSMPQFVGGGVLVLIGILWLLERTGAIDISVTAVLGLGAMVTGISLMLLAKDGTHVGLIVFGTLLALVTLVTAAAPFEGFQGGVGDRTVVVSSVDDIRADYNLAMGTLTIDLRNIEDVGTSTRLSASVGMGELMLLVPADLQIDVDAQAGAGEIEILGRVIEGVDLDDAYTSPGFVDSDQRLSLDLRVFTGRVEVSDE
jgi:Cell wall-active antibiotics response 4TMS YvqF